MTSVSHGWSRAIAATHMMTTPPATSRAEISFTGWGKLNSDRRAFIGRKDTRCRACVSASRVLGVRALPFRVAEWKRKPGTVRALLQRAQRYSAAAWPQTDAAPCGEMGSAVRA